MYLPLLRTEGFGHYIRDFAAGQLAGRATILGSTPIPALSPTPALPVGDTIAIYDDNGNGRISCAEVRAHGIAPLE